MRNYLTAAVVAGAAALGAAAQGSIVTNTYTATIGSFGTSDPDGAFYPLGTTATVAISFDNALTYIGGPDSVVQTLVTLPAGLTVTVGSDVFTADTYYITFYNAGAFRPSSAVDFRTSIVPFGGFPVLHNGLPFGGGQNGYFQFSFYGPNTFTPTPIAPGLSFPLPPFIGEGMVRENTNSTAHEYYLQQGSWAEVPGPGAAGALGLGGLVALRRRRV